MFLNALKPIFENAKALRANLTHTEMLMWGYLKQRPLGYKFRRQYPIAQFIADFYCHELKMIIEIDGEVHNRPEVQISDAKRQAYLEDKGIGFLRFTNDEVETQMGKVIQRIEANITIKRNSGV